MLAFLLTLLIVISVSYAVYSGDTQVFSNCIAGGAETAVSLCFSLAANMAFWGGILKISDKIGVTRVVTLSLSKPIGRLFKGLDDKELLGLISLNVSANMLGLGNAALPIALSVMKRLKNVDGCKGRYTAMFVLLNTASLQLLPITTAALRSRHGAAAPWDILPASLLTSAAALAAGLTATAIIFQRREQAV